VSAAIRLFGYCDWLDGWMDGCRLATQMQFRFPQFVPTPIAQLIPNASPEGVSLMQVHTVPPYCHPILHYTWFVVAAVIIRSYDLLLS